VGYKIPNAELLREIIGEVLQRHREVYSQDSLHSLVQSKLWGKDKTYRVSPPRVRRTAAGMGEVGIRVVKMRSRREFKECFVCGGKLAIAESFDLFGGRTSSSRKCEQCGYEMERENMGPRKYIFYRR
jgi:hypothetical protein